MVRALIGDSLAFPLSSGRIRWGFRPRPRVSSSAERNATVETGEGWNLPSAGSDAKLEPNSASRVFVSRRVELARAVVPRAKLGARSETRTRRCRRAGVSGSAFFALLCGVPGAPPPARFGWSNLPGVRGSSGRPSRFALPTLRGETSRRGARIPRLPQMSWDVPAIRFGVCARRLSRGSARSPVADETSQ